MDAQHIATLKTTLLEEKTEIENQLRKFAQKNPAIKGDWTTKQAGIDDSASALDEKAQNVMVYEEHRAIEQSLELRLKEIDETLVRLDQGNYGICTNCKNTIEPKRLAAALAVKYCFSCASNSTLT